MSAENPYKKTYTHRRPSIDEEVVRAALNAIENEHRSKRRRMASTSDADQADAYPPSLPSSPSPPPRRQRRQRRQSHRQRRQQRRRRQRRIIVTDVDEEPDAPSKPDTLPQYRDPDVILDNAKRVHGYTVMNN